MDPQREVGLGSMVLPAGILFEVSKKDIETFLNMRLKGGIRRRINVTAR